MSLRIQPVAARITEDDAAIARALERASIPTLMMSMIHMSGDTRLLDGPIRPGKAVPGDTQGGLSAADRAAVRARALEVIRAYRDRGCTLPPLPPRETIRRMLSFVVGEEVPDAYAPMMLEEMALDGRDARDVTLGPGVPPEVRAGLRVVVIGAGMSGILMAIRLEAAGIPYVVVEKNPAVGGTWYENVYPGCRVDVPNHFYSFSFDPNPDWSHYYSEQEELRDYFERCVDKYGVRERIRFETEVVSARWDEEHALWSLRLRGAGGREEILEADAVVSAVGQLNRPRIPDLPGLADFRGAAFHSAEWDAAVPLEGRRVAVVGTGASALQLVPEVAKVAGRLTVFQRSPSWVAPNPRYHTRVSDEARWLLKHLPYYARWFRFLAFWPGSDGLMPSLERDPAWPHPERSVSALNDATREVFTAWIRSQVGDDPELLEKVVPRYPPFVKRMLQDDGSWFSALRRDNVELVTEAIARVVPGGIVTGDGVERPCDVIVFATGFHANRFLWPMEITGRDGRGLRELWGDDPRAYLGITVPGFPNLFCLYGPGTNLGHAGSIIFHSECQVRYVMGCLKALLERGVRALDCRPEVCDAYTARFDARHAELVWSHPGTRSWFKNEKGRVTTTSPWLLRDYWAWTREPDLSDYELIRTPRRTP